MQLYFNKADIFYVPEVMKEPEEKPGTTFVQPSVPEKGIIVSLLDFLHCSCLSSSMCSLFPPKYLNQICFVRSVCYHIKCVCVLAVHVAFVWRCLILFMWCPDILKNLKTRSLLRKKSYLSRWQSKKNNPHAKVLAVCFQCVYCSVLIVV